MKKDLSKLSMRQLQNRYDRLVRGWYRKLAGGTSFGIDWPTVHATFPEEAKEALAIRNEARSRKVGQPA